MFSDFVANEKDYTLWLNLVWGLREQDLSGCDFSDYKCEGRTVFDDSFNPNSAPAQLGLKVTDFLDYKHTPKNKQTNKTKKTQYLLSLHRLTSSTLSQHFHQDLSFNELGAPFHNYVCALSPPLPFSLT